MEKRLFLMHCFTENGNLRYAKEFIAEASAHASVYGDTVTHAWCLHLSARIFFLEGDVARSIQVPAFSQAISLLFTIILVATTSITKFGGRSRVLC
jgi:hypothetical protein